MDRNKKIKSGDIDEILDRKIVSGKVRYLVKWRRFSELNTWEPIENFDTGRQIIADFENRFNSRRTAERGISAPIVKHAAAQAARRSTANPSMLNRRSIINSKKTHTSDSATISVQSFAAPVAILERNSQKQLLRIMENEFHCCICHDMLEEAVVTECGHFFCDKCIKEWKRISNSCPVCRGSLFRREIKVPAVNNFISKAITVLKK